MLTQNLKLQKIEFEKLKQEITQKINYINQIETQVLLCYFFWSYTEKTSTKKKFPRLTLILLKRQLQIVFAPKNL